MRRHAFGWGTALYEPRLLGRLSHGDDGRRYREAVGAHGFNKFVLEGGATRWNVWERNNGKQKAVEIALGRRSLEWLRDNNPQGKNVTLRAIPVVWPSWHFSGESARTLYEQTLARDGEDAAKAALAKRVNDHVREVMTLFKDIVDEWDVLNEVYTQGKIVEILGREAAVEWFKIAREIDPTAKLFINDYAILEAGGLDTAHQDAYYDLVKFLLDNGAPIDGVGIQSHFGGVATPPEKMLEILDRFAKLGKPIQVTEFDVGITDEALQDDFTRDFLITLFSHPSVMGIVMWGFWDGQHWKDNAPLYRRDWSLKPSGKVWNDLVSQTWWTDTQSKTDAQGRLAVRGFLGDYEIVVTRGGKTKTVQTTLAPGGKTIAVALE